ncbi:hypothetical protein D3C73_1511270 [compost metagenome]
MLHHISNAVQREADFRRIGLKFALAQILMQGRDNFRLIAADGILQLLQLAKPEGGLLRSPAVKPLTVLGQHLFNALGC